MLLSFEQARKQLNRYTTTLHAINSAVIKLGKLTKATKVYRGISGMALPKEFWDENEFGVRGGVENAFMSTTLERHVAMGYASGDGAKTGIVIEVQQGMVNRGASISDLSQYPHEAEILFGPLTGIEVLGTRVEGSVVVIKCAFNANLAALTLEEVLGKRRKVVRDMCEQLALRARHAAAGEAWAVLRRGADDVANVPAAVGNFLQTGLLALAGKEDSHYNDNAPLGAAINEAVEIAELLASWPKGLRALAEVAVVRGTGGYGRPTTVEELVSSEGPIKLSLSDKVGKEVPIDVVHGMCALMWVRPPDAPLALDLKATNLGARRIGPPGLAALSRAMTPTLTALDLAASSCTHDGGDLSSIRLLSAALSCAAAAGLHELNLNSCCLCNVGVEGGTALAEGLKGNAALRTLSLAVNMLGVEGTKAVSAGLPASAVTSLDLTDNQLRDEGARAVAAVLAASAITDLNLSDNSIGVDGGKAIGLAVQASAVRVLNLNENQICGLSRFSQEKGSYSADGLTVLSQGLQGSAVTSLDLGKNCLGAVGAHTIAAALPGTAITRLTVDLAGPLPIGELRGTIPTDSINLTRRSLDVASAVVIASCIKENGLLKRLDLSANSGLGVEGSKTVVAALPSNALTELHLNGVDLTGQRFLMKTDVQGSTFEAGAKVTYQGREMTVVVPDEASLRYARDKDKKVMVADLEGVLALAASLSECKSLTSLGLERNKLGREGVEALAKGLRGNSTLRLLSLRENNFEADSGPALAAMLREVTQISTVEV